MSRHEGESRSARLVEVLLGAAEGTISDEEAMKRLQAICDETLLLRLATRLAAILEPES